MADRLRVLFVTPELAPWVKAGGLGDVAHGLPLALGRAGVDVRILVPAYRELARAFPEAEVLGNLDAWGGAFAPAQLLTASGEIPLYLLGCPDYFARGGGAYQSPQGADWPDNHLRFGLLGRAAAAFGSGAMPIDWTPDIVHCNDWQSGLAPAYLSARRTSAANASMERESNRFSPKRGIVMSSLVPPPWRREVSTSTFRASTGSCPLA